MIAEKLQKDFLEWIKKNNYNASQDINGNFMSDETKALYAAFKYGAGMALLLVLECMLKKDK